MCNEYVDMAGNMNLFLNCMDWLAGRQDLVSVRPKTMDTRLMSLTRKQVQLTFWLSVVVVPMGSVLVGVVVMRRRRQQA